MSVGRRGFILPYDARLPRKHGRKHQHIIINLLRTGHMPELYRSMCMFDLTQSWLARLLNVKFMMIVT
jgi:hypothetical protein